jgi:hypothetical protein
MDVGGFVVLMKRSAFDLRADEQPLRGRPPAARALDSVANRIAKRLLLNR